MSNNKQLNELEALTNALNSLELTGYSILPRSGRRNTYSLVDEKGYSVSGNWDYIRLNHFIMGFGKSMKMFSTTVKHTDSKHTPGKISVAPSRISKNDKHYYILSEQGAAIGKVHIEQEGEDLEGHANAARIVQCWNEHDTLKEKVETLDTLYMEEIAENKKLKQQRDELLEALKIAENYVMFSVQNGSIGESQKDLDKICAAIQKATQQ